MFDKVRSSRARCPATALIKRFNLSFAVLVTVLGGRRVAAWSPVTGNLNWEVYLPGDEQKRYQKFAQFSLWYRNILSFPKRILCKMKIRK